jgi:hypothetical protein
LGPAFGLITKPLRKQAALIMATQQHSHVFVPVHIGHEEARALLLGIWTFFCTVDLYLPPEAVKHYAGEGADALRKLK